MPAIQNDPLPFPFPTVAYKDRAVVLIDQTVLPDELRWRRCEDVPALCLAIRELAVRGAPAIGVAAAYGLVLAWESALAAGGDAEQILKRVANDRQMLAATRPTAVNLFWALDRMYRLASDRVAAGDDSPTIFTRLHDEAGRILAEDLDRCRALGKAGADLLPATASVLTHCNAGGLATGGYGTALGVIYAAQAQGKQIHVYADETRPLLQGARLTAWELASQGVEVTLLCDSAAASLLRRGGIDAVITGADRIAANGDTANKIRTYPLAVMAREHEVPFYVAAPASTFDGATRDGNGIEVEQRAEAEVLGFGPRRMAPAGISAYNPAFDVTPAALITAFITEYGVLRPPYSDSLRPVLNPD
ncbi:MAG: S-methyl-5-thioribose-1-phosphate isomerase [bacterium]